MFFFTAFPLFGAVPLGGLRLLTPQAGGAPRGAPLQVRDPP